MQEYLYSLATDRRKGPVAGLIKIFLYVLSLIYGLAVLALMFVCRLGRRSLKCKVISVGNITLGGTGKTSLVEFIARYLKTKGRKAAILSRGYKKTNSDYGMHYASYGTMGDEPYMLKVNLKDVPVLVDANRIRAASLAVSDYGSDTLILDDGLQQWKIKKDLEIVTIDSTNPFGNRRLIPRGILRQPISTLRSADIFILTKTNFSSDVPELKKLLGRINPQAELFESVHEPEGFYKLDESDKLLDTGELKGKTVTLISGIGDPLSFERMIRDLGVKIGLSFRFEDHHHYSKKDLEDIIAQSRKSRIEAVVTTQKDAIRINPEAMAYKPISVFVLRIALKIIKDEEKFYNRLLKLYSAEVAWARRRALFAANLHIFRQNGRRIALFI
ncbi:MAG: tetraacyldisaccharide 4'-kinase [Deltaproteobacteria bacterium]